ncbi:cellulose biosynthesis cyclic di-GMP-binding regulatory protein BcsB [Pararhodobacter sp.]|uniref:cellulose biosynthesis cyclic di-GMP-binding regulatory protein BcsB n=1 Tax=Pararhodobacter sp. TaxID=2127056 RepID=UPI002FDD4719
MAPVDALFQGLHGALRRVATAALIPARAATPLAVLALCATFTAPAVLAQGGGGLIVVPLGPGEAEVDDAISDSLLQDRVAPDRARGTQVAPSGAPQGLVSPLRPVIARGQPQGSAIRFDGESRTLDFALFVPDPARAESLRLATLSSINVLPERSHFQVYVNDQFVGEGRLENFTQTGTTDLAVPPGILTAGHNRVQIRLRQYHRIFCGPEASFSLWTDIDLSRSGAVITGMSAESTESSFLMGLALSAATGSGIEIRGTSGLGDQREGWVSLITQRLTAALGGDPVPFRFTDFWTVQPDDTAAGGRITFLPGNTGRISYRTGGDGAQVMVIEYVPGQPASGLPGLDLALPALPARAAPTLIQATRPVPFSAFGFRPVEVQDRYALIEQRFRLPDDYVVLTNAKAEIRLDYIYADDLPAGSMLLVHVNGHNIRLLPLRGEAGRLIEQFPLRFEARYLQAGANNLAFEVMVPGDPPDLPCPVWDNPVLAIGAESTINVPYSPSMYLPDMHFAFRALTPQSVQPQAHAARSYDADDLITLRAALAGSMTGRSDTGARLHLLSLDDLASLPLGGHPVNRQVIENVLLGGDDTAVQPMASEGLGGSLLRMTGDTGGMRQPPAAVSSGWDRAVGLFNTALQWMHPRSGGLLEQWLRQQRGQAILLQLDTERPDNLWLLRSAGTDIAGLASAIVAARTMADGPRGQVSVLDSAGRWQNWIAPDRQPVLLEPISPRNLRHVLGNLVSAMPIRYVSVLFLLALVAALVALRLVISTREQQQ